jgi:hypothetical protein
MSDEWARVKAEKGLIDPEQNGQAPADELRARMLAGGQFILDAPEEIPAVWGTAGQVAWAQGEPCLIVGPAGVGKTTVAGQLVKARLELGSAVLGMPVTPGKRRVLYLACDRPEQFRRSLRRMVSEADRAELDARLVVWKGPPPGDCAKHPETLLRMAEAADADTVIGDSLKDLAIGLSEDEVGAGLNRAHQRLVAEGIEYLGLHHQRKNSAGGGKPTKLEDVYGSTWITAGAGSVILLWGEAGDSIVELSHLKQPDQPIGPWKILHDHDSGVSSVQDRVDLVHLATISPSGITAKDAAVALFGSLKPSDNEVEKARRQLEGLVRRELLKKIPGSRGGGAERDPARYVALSRLEER